jgi:hypothetical protein
MAGNFYVRLVIGISSPLKSEGKIRLGEFLAIIYPDIGFAPKGRNVKNSRIEGVCFFRFHHANLNFEIGWFARLGYFACHDILSRIW